MVPVNRLERASCVADTVVEEESPDPVCDARGGTATPGVFAGGAASDCNVALTAADEIDQFCDIGRIILPVAVEHDEDVPGSKMEAGVEGTALTSIFREAQWTDTFDVLHEFPRPIGTAVIHGDDFGVGLAGDDFAKDKFDAFFLVVKGNDNTDGFFSGRRIAQSGATGERREIAGGDHAVRQTVFYGFWGGGLSGHDFRCMPRKTDTDILRS